MVYLIEPVNRSTDSQGRITTPLGFISPMRFFRGTNALKREFKPIPPNMIHQNLEIGGNRRMPDFFFLEAEHYYVSSRFRSVLEKYASGAVEYIDVAFNIPANKDPADAYYFINVLGRSQLMDWELTTKSSRGEGYFFWEGGPDRWVMRAPPAGHVAIGHETDRIETDAKYFGSGTHVFVINELGDALNAAFPRQCVLPRIREMQALV